MKLTVWSYAFVAAGGALGAMARFGLHGLLQRNVAFPWGTLTANLAGCFLMGVAAQLIANSAWFNASGVVPYQYRLFFAVGFCGSFTTLSAFMFELNALIQKNEILYSFSYIVATLIGGFACFYAGLMLMRTVQQV